MSFYEFVQNNSGGSFDFDGKAGISHFVIVEADSTEEAVSTAREIGLYFDGVGSGQDCSCCGDRWYEPWEEGTETPEIYAQDVSDGIYSPQDALIQGGWMYPKPEGYIHFKDGTIRAVMQTQPEETS